MRYPYDDMLERQRQAYEEGPERTCPECGGAGRLGAADYCESCGGCGSVLKVDGEIFVEKHHGPSPCDYGPEY